MTRYRMFYFLIEFKHAQQQQFCFSNWNSSVHACRVENKQKSPISKVFFFNHLSNSLLNECYCWSRGRTFSSSHKNVLKVSINSSSVKLYSIIRTRSFTAQVKIVANNYLDSVTSSSLCVRKSNLNNAFLCLF